MRHFHVRSEFYQEFESHSSGKSTLIKAFCDARKGAEISVIEGLTRAIIKRGFPLAKDSTVDSYTNYIRDQFRITRLYAAKNPDILITDRAILDAASYARVNTTLPRPYVPDYFVEMLLEAALLESNSFDLFVYCPVEFPMVSDGVRPVDEGYRDRVGLQILDFLKAYNINFIEVRGDINARLQTLNHSLDKLYE